MAMREWFTPAEIVAAKSPDLPGTVRNINSLADARCWRADPARARRATGKGGGWEYHVSLLPPGAQARLTLLHAPQAVSTTPRRSEASSRLWDRFKGLSQGQKDECQRRFDALVVAEKLVSAGMGETAAALQAASTAGTSPATIYNWRKMVRSVDRADWLAALAPSYVATSTFAACHPTALDALKTDWLRPEEPTFSSCYRRVRKLASKNGWLPFPSERALRRRIDAEVPEAVQVLARSGRKKAKTLYPAQKRTRAHLHAMQAVNMDGHKLDVFVLLADGRIVRMQLIGLQDLYSGKILAWRISETENKETTRLVIGDMVSLHGIPAKIVLDNGRAFASKWISGGTANRYRFKVRDGDPQGLLTTLGVEIVWAKPYSGQSKPIERAWRDLADTISKHPFCSGAYTGNRPDAKPENYASTAIPVEAFRAHVSREIAEHNARSGRKLETCAGRSFDETFAASMALPSTIVTWPTEAQRTLWLLAADQIKARPGSGEIHFYGNRYWSSELNQHAGRPVVVRFDPDQLQEPIMVYTADDKFITAAPCIQATGFFDQDAARTHARDRGAYEKALREQRRLTTKMSVDELARMLADEKPAAPAPVPPKVKRLATGGGAAPVPLTNHDEEFDAGFSRALRMFGDDADIIPFTPRRSEDG